MTERTESILEKPDFYEEQPLLQLAETYKSIRVLYTGSRAGQAIPVLTIGGHRDSRRVFYTADTETAGILLRFAAEYAALLEAGKRVYRIRLPYLYASRTVQVMPFVRAEDADGVRMPGCFLHLHLHSRDGLLRPDGQTGARGRTLERLLARMTGKETAAAGPYRTAYPCFAVGCRPDRGDTPERVYASLREALFTAPLLI